MNKDRNYLFDNAKALLIILVVIGHFADYYTSSSEDMRILFFVIYLFHMPLFIFIAGLFSKSVINSSRFKFEKVFSYIILYFILKIAFYTLSKYIFLNQNAQLTFFIEGGLPWFMLAMAAWLSITYLLKDIKPTYVLTFSVVTAILVGYDERVTDFLVTSRILVYFPYFLLGYYLKPESIGDFVGNTKVKIVAWAILILSSIIIFTQIENLYSLRLFLTGRNSYAALESEIIGGPIRFTIMIITIILSIVILAILPNEKKMYSIIGKRTLQIYFLHHLILSTYHHFKLNDILAGYFPIHWLKIYMLLAIVLTIILTHRIFEKPFRYINSIEFMRIRV